MSGKEALKILAKNGFSIARQKGSHVHLIKEIDGRRLHVTVPVHGNKDLNPFVMRSIIRQAGYTPEKFTEML